VDLAPPAPKLCFSAFAPRDRHVYRRCVVLGEELMRLVNVADAIEQIQSVLVFSVRRRRKKWRINVQRLPPDPGEFTAIAAPVDHPAGIEAELQLRLESGQMRSAAERLWLQGVDSCEECLRPPEEVDQIAEVQQD
jgi:hypothetical protein